MVPGIVKNVFKQKTQQESDVIAVTPTEHAQRQFSAKSCVLLILIFSFGSHCRLVLPRDVCVFLLAKVRHQR